MVQERAREIYSGIKAPAGLKESVRSSIKMQRVRMAKQSAAWLSAAACLVLVFLSGMFDGTAPLVRMDGEVIAEQAIGLETYTEDTGLAIARSLPAAMARSLPGDTLQENGNTIRVPLEISVAKTARVRVSEGTLQDSVEAAVEGDSVTELDISGERVVYWVLEGNAGLQPVCTVTTKEGNYEYVIEFDEDNAVFTIKQKK